MTEIITADGNISPRCVVQRGKLRGKTHESVVVEEYWLNAVSR